MSFVSSLLNGSKGTGFQAQTNTPQIQSANNLVNTGINQQQNFVNALTGAQGLQNQQNVFGQQQQTAQQLQNIANGQGPNPAMAALNQATGANVANQAALMAGLRGSGANAGLMARQAAQQGAATQQQAVGQGATMQAQQSLGALQQLQAQQQAMQGVAGTQVSQQQTGLQALNQASLQNQSNQMNLQSSANSANAQIAGVNANMQGNIMGGLMGAAGSALQMIAEGGEVKRMKDGGEYADTSTDNFDTASAAPATPAPAMPASYMPGTTTPGNWTPPTTSSGPTAASMALPNAGSSTTKSGPKSATAKLMVGNSAPAQGTYQLGTGIGHAIGAGLHALFSPATQSQTVSGGSADTTSGGNQPLTPNTSNVDMTQDSTAVAARGGKAHKKVPALVSKGEIRIHKKDVKKVAEGKKSPLSGEKIPGKPKYPGNDYRNDIVPKTLNEGDIIIPNSIMQSKNPQWQAHKFVADILSGKHRKK